MKHLILAALASIALTGMAHADDLIGDWRTAPDDHGNTGLIRVAQCGAALCGTLIEAFDGAGTTMESEHVGRQIIWETLPEGGGEYRGRLYSPDRDRTYRSRLQLNGDELVVSGCILGGAACREGGRWQRVN
ncbi:DUF2147 domain-containing protein [Rhodophyticola sp. CCM32]|uniref:DUF2147 domain-containing protein n=1 Tax=Rhodophyticola sp. CCM32 TaxID=2916397 RepID=UPI00107F732C|nr:DUF2147 domain-containing protein [Rhodophyticola sp. CCM32]QBY01248.1 DUF2147 domain-containing protein [Rhodophyticola sp. CCM32]